MMIFISVRGHYLRECDEDTTILKYRYNTSFNIFLSLFPKIAAYYRFICMLIMLINYIDKFEIFYYSLKLF